MIPETCGVHEEHGAPQDLRAQTSATGHLGPDQSGVGFETLGNPKGHGYMQRARCDIRPRVQQS